MTSFIRSTTFISRASALIGLTFLMAGAASAQDLTISVDGVDTAFPVESFSTRDKTGVVSVSADGGSITLDGDAWKSISVNYLITSDTVLAFDYQSTVEGERQGLGVDTNQSPNTTSYFKLYGTERWGRTEFENYASSELSSYSIPIGELVNVRRYTFLVFMNEMGGNGTYSNIRIFEEGGAGSDGNDGMDGEAGSDGNDGSTILSGFGAPDNDIGGDGDFYVDRANALFFGPKSGGAWSEESIALVGPTGAQGPPGAAGAQGMQGIPGADGENGALGMQGETGAEGSEGRIGPAGPAGPAGSQGEQGPAGADTLGNLTCLEGETAISDEESGGEGLWSCGSPEVSVVDPVIAGLLADIAALKAAVFYQIGDTGPGGGIVFKVDASGTTGLEAAPGDQSGGVVWCNVSGLNIPGVVYIGGGFDSPTIPVDYNSGSVITPKIADACATSAAAIAAQYPGPDSTTLGDWFLPNIFELDQMYENIGPGCSDTNIGCPNVGGFANDDYWSSSELNSVNAWRQTFSDSIQFASGRLFPVRVRAVRAF